MAYKTLLLEKKGKITVLTFNRPARLNAVNATMNTEIPRAIQEVAADDSCRVLVLTGSGRGFCAGGDFRGDEDSLIGSETVQTANRTAGSAAKLVRGYTRPIALALMQLNIPTVAMVNGVAVGQGFSMSQACDIRIGSTNARFRVGWTVRGLAAAFGDTWMLPRIIGLGRSLELIYTARFLESEEAFRIGYLNKLVPPEKLEEETMEMANQLANGPGVALRLDKWATYAGLNMDFGAALDMLAVSQGIALTSDDFKEATKAFQEKREPAYKGN